MIGFEIDQRIKPVVPEKNGSIQADGSKRGAGQRQNDTEQYPEIAQTVDHGCFFQFLRNGFEEIDEDDQEKLIDGKGEQNCPDRSRQMKAGNQKIVGNHTAGKKHGENDQLHDDFLSSEPRLAERIGKEDHHKKGDEGASNGEDQGVAISPEKMRIMKYL